MKNWKTTSTGITLIVGAIVTIIFTLTSATLTQEIIMGAVTAVLSGIGLLFAKDYDVPKEEK